MIMTKLPTSSGIYQILCTANGKIYIGSAVNLRKRWNEHQRRLVNQAHHNAPLQRAWDKYGQSAFVCTVLEFCDSSTLLEREQYHLDLLSPFGKRGFNIAIAAGASMLGRSLSPEARAKLSAANKGKVMPNEVRAKISSATKGRPKSAAARANIISGQQKMSPETRAATNAAISSANKGRKHSPETHAKISAKAKLRIPSPETRAKIGQSLKGKVLSVEHRSKIGASNKGHTHSPEAKSKMSAAAKTRTPESRIEAMVSRRKSYLVTSPCGAQMLITGLRQFCREQNLTPGAMLRVANGEKSHHKGWKCEHVPTDYPLTNQPALPEGDDES
jgi:group I intron endonuclease